MGRYHRLPNMWGGGSCRMLWCEVWRWEWPTNDNRKNKTIWWTAKDKKKMRSTTKMRELSLYRHSSTTTTTTDIIQETNQKEKFDHSNGEKTFLLQQKNFLFRTCSSSRTTGPSISWITTCVQSEREKERKVKRIGEIVWLIDLVFEDDNFFHIMELKNKNFIGNDTFFFFFPHTLHSSQQQPTILKFTQGDNNNNNTQQHTHNRTKKRKTYIAAILNQIWSHFIQNKFNIFPCQI